MNEYLSSGRVQHADDADERDVLFVVDELARVLEIVFGRRGGRVDAAEGETAERVAARAVLVHEPEYLLLELVRHGNLGLADADVRAALDDRLGCALDVEARRALRRLVGRHVHRHGLAVARELEREVLDELLPDDVVAAHGLLLRRQHRLVRAVHVHLLDEHGERSLGRLSDLLVDLRNGVERVRWSER